ncbi:MAG: SDR family oxidoreductase [Persicimonas sp.]
MTDRDIATRRALVTGGGSGIGLAVVELLLDAGLEVCALDRRPAPVEHERLHFIEADVTRADQVDMSYVEVDRRLGGLDVLVSNAGVGIHERLDQGDPAKWQALIETNLIGAMRVVRAFAPMLEQAEEVGDLVVVSSVADRNAYAFGGPYAASKAGLSMMAETLRLELQPGVRVTLVRPGMVASSFYEHSIDQSNLTPEEVGWTPLPPEQVAQAVLFALTRPPQVAINELTIRPTEQSF